MATNSTIQNVFKIDFNHLSVLAPLFNDGIVLGMGNFDGVHLGHQEIIKNCVYAASIFKSEAVILSFAPHPVSVLRPDLYRGLIMTNDDKYQKILRLGIDKIIEIKFDKEFAKISAEDFLSAIFFSLRPKKIITGDNFYFGFQKSGNANLLNSRARAEKCRYLGLRELFHDGKKISSSLIRDCLSKGFIRRAGALLNSYYEIKGVIVKGKGNGLRLFDTPTANLYWNDQLSNIRFGVYLTEVYIKGIKYYGITNVGNRPSLSGAQGVWIESYILELDRVLYDTEVTLKFIMFLRPERKFNSLLALKFQIKRDVFFGDMIRKLKGFDSLVL